MVGRKTIDNELEDTYKYPNPIMEFPLFRGARPPSPSPYPYPCPYP